MTLFADDDVVVHGNTERVRHRDDLLRHLDVGVRRRQVPGRAIAHEDDADGWSCCAAAATSELGQSRPTRMLPVSVQVRNGLKADEGVER